MCTVVYLKTDNGFIISSNRDENPNRQIALPPKKYLNNKVEYYCPIDPVGKGTWWATNQYGNVIVLLNGGFNNHIKKETYAKSRGLIVTELISFENSLQKIKEISLSNIEPFTLIILEKEKLVQFVWDGDEKCIISKDEHIPHIWSSSTLYNQEIKALRENYFNSWILERKYNSLEILKFLNSYKDVSNGFIMKRNKEVQTINISIISKENDLMNLNYKDLLRNCEDNLEYFIN